MPSAASRLPLGIVIGFVLATCVWLSCAMIGGSGVLSDAGAEPLRQAQPLLLVSTLVRLPRYMLMAFLAAGLSRGLGAGWSCKRKLALLVGCWAVFYVVYFGYFTYLEWVGA